MPARIARELSQLLRRQTRPGTSRPIVQEAFGPGGVDAMNPVAQRLSIHAADLGRFAPLFAVADRHQRQQPPALINILRAPGQSQKLPGLKIQKTLAIYGAKVIEITK